MALKLTDKEDIEIKILLEAVRLRHGYDFRQYAAASLARRIRKCLSDSGLSRISDMIPLIIHDKDFFQGFLHNLSVNVTQMFRDPNFFLTLRRQIVPYLDTFPFIKIWSVGVASGEEVYSLAIILKEEGVYKKALIYATDFNDTVLNRAQKGIYSADSIQTSTVNYQKAGGKTSFAEYYHADYDSVILDRSLKKNIVFANHNLATDSVFGEMNLILCRNVLIYFNKDLQDRVLELLRASLRPHGFLCLGTRESVEFSRVAHDFEPVDKTQRIFQHTGS